MLKALLHRKLPRSTVDYDDYTEDVVRIEPTRREDPFTAAILERFAYLPPGMTWKILSRVCKLPASGSALPLDSPVGVPEFKFRPGLCPGMVGANMNRVEPDVLIS